MNQQDDNKQPSTRDGFWFFFNIDNLKIAAQTTVWSKYREVIYINDEIYSDKRSLNGQGSHLIVIEGTQYQIVFEVTSVFTGELLCKLYKDGKLIATEKTAYYGDPRSKNAWRVVWKTAGLATLISFIIAFSFATFY